MRALCPPDPTGPALQSPPRAPQRARGRRVLTLCLASSLGWLAACAGSGRKAETPAEVERLVRGGQFEAALVLADRLAAAAPNDGERAALRREALVALLLERGRRLSFADQDDAALEQLDAALAVDPASEVAAAWRARVIAKLSERWLSIGREAHASSEFEAAMAGYERALAYDPENSAASFQIEELAKYLGWRRDSAGQYYNHGVRSLSGSRLAEARAGFESSRKYEDGDPARTERRLNEVRSEQAIGLLHLAEEQAQKGYWRSAHRTLVRALELDPEVPNGVTLREHYAVEADVAGQRQAADIARLRGEFERARELLLAAKPRSERQSEAIADELLVVDTAEADHLYDTALALESDFRFEEAAAAYRELLATRQVHADARARLGTLEDAIRVAPELYEQARKAKTDAERVDLYRQLELIWPEYRDVQQRLAEARARLAKAPKG